LRFRIPRSPGYAVVKRNLIQIRQSLACGLGQEVNPLLAGQIYGFLPDRAPGYETRTAGLTRDLKLLLERVEGFTGRQQSPGHPRSRVQFGAGFGPDRLVSLVASME